MKTKDADVNKGAMEDAPDDRDRPGESHNRMANQLAHRDKSDEMEGHDTDFPEPGSSPEHS